MSVPVSRSKTKLNTALYLLYEYMTLDALLIDIKPLNILHIYNKWTLNGLWTCIVSNNRSCIYLPTNEPVSDVKIFDLDNQIKTTLYPLFLLMITRV